MSAVEQKPHGPKTLQISFLKFKSTPALCGKEQRIFVSHLRDFPNSWKFMDGAINVSDAFN